MYFKNISTVNLIWYDMIEIIELLIPVIIGIAYITIAERKILASMQRRQGPIKVGPKGILQIVADGIKLIMKESIIPSFSDSILFIISPILALSIALILWLFMPISKGIFFYDELYSLIIIYAITSLGIYSVIYSGWSSYSKYAYLGSIRSISQILSYEISIGLILMTIISINQTFNLNIIIQNQIYCSNIYLLLPISVFFFISILAETLRSPFDIVESESELVAGNLVEYAGLTFTALYLAEYSNIILFSLLASILFFGNYFITFFFIFCFIWVRGSLPRLRWDLLLLLGWTNILPFSIGYFFFLFNLFFFLS